MSYRNSYRNGYGNGVAYGRSMGVEHVTFKSISEIETVLDGMETIIKKKGFATTEDYYRLTDGTIMKDDSKIGWTSLLDCNITKSRYGYELRMPIATRVDINECDILNETYELLQNAGEEDAYDIVIEARQRLSEAL